MISVRVSTASPSCWPCVRGLGGGPGCGSFWWRGLLARYAPGLLSSVSVVAIGRSTGLDNTLFAAKNASIRSDDRMSCRLGGAPAARRCVMSQTTDPTFYRSPGATIAAPAERLAYVAAFDPTGQ